MKANKFSDSQILNILKEYESGISARELGRKHGFYYQTLYEWKKRFSGITQISEVQKIRELELENEKLKKMFAEASMRIHALEDVISKKW
jgi:putative transposase